MGPLYCTYIGFSIGKGGVFTAACAVALWLVCIYIYVVYVQVGSALVQGCKFRIRDYLAPKLVPRPKSYNSDPKTLNPNRILLVQNSKKEFVWDKSSDSHKFTLTHGIVLVPIKLVV